VRGEIRKNRWQGRGELIWANIAKAGRDPRSVLPRRKFKGQQQLKRSQKELKVGEGKESSGGEIPCRKRGVVVRKKKQGPERKRGKGSIQIDHRSTSKGSKTGKIRNETKGTRRAGGRR